VFGSPTATFEVVRNTGNPSSEKAGVGGSTPSLATTFSGLDSTSLSISLVGQLLNLSRWPQFCDHSVTSADVRLSVGKSNGTLRREEMILNDGVLHLSRAFLVIVNDTIDTTAHGITPNEPSIVGAQQFGHCGHVLHARIEPEIVAVLIKDDWHSVMNRRCDGICSRRQDRAGLQRFDVWDHNGPEIVDI